MSESVDYTPPPHVGRVLSGRWAVGERIGVGGMANVHTGRDLRLERQVAIKILHPHVSESPEARERLAREARAIAQLRHEGVIEVYDYCIDDDRCTWLVTELVEGASLRRTLDRHERIMPEIAVMIVSELLRALKAAHDSGIIHRDIKPDNILVGKEGRPKLSDFGIAKVMRESQMTITGNLIGSPSYMSPEQADGVKTDHRTDLFSVGSLLYRLVTGKVPFKGNSPIDTIRKVSEREFVDPVELQPDCAGPLAGVIRRALAFELEDRYSSAEEMLSDLTSILQDAGMSQTWAELPAFFKDPPGYQERLRGKLAHTLEARGRFLLNSGEEARAVDCFNRALGLGSGSQHTMDLVKELSKKRAGQSSVRKVLLASGMAVGALGVIALIVLMVDVLSSNPPPSPALASESTGLIKAEPLEYEAPRAPEKPTPKPTLAAPDTAEPKPVKRTKKRRRRAKRIKTEKPQPTSTEAPDITPPIAPVKPDAPPAKPVKKGTLQVGTRHWVDVYVDGKKLGRAPNKSHYKLNTGTHVLRAEKPNCVPFERPFTIEPGKTTRLRLNVVCP